MNNNAKKRSLRMRLSYIAILALSSLCAVTAYGQAKPAEPPKATATEILQVNVARDAAGERKTTNYIAFTVQSDFKPSTILDFSLVALFEKLSGDEKRPVFSESSEIESKKFNQRISPQLKLPPGRYYLAVYPSTIQKNKAISVSGDDQLRMGATKFVVIGTIGERLDFMKNEFQTASGYNDELENIYQEMQKITDKSKADNKAPADDNTFQQWQKKSAARVAVIDKDIAVQMQNQGYLTFYTFAFSKLHELTALLRQQLDDLNKSVITANKNKNAPFSFAVSAKAPGLIAEIKSFLTKETIFDLGWFYYALVEDTVLAYETARNASDPLKEWMVQEAVCNGYSEKSSIFMAGFKPPAPVIWKNHSAKIGELQKISREIKEDYRKQIDGDRSDKTVQRLEELKKSIGLVLGDLRTALNK
jgi:hypothetical protein